MQRIETKKEQFATELKKILIEYPSDKSTQDAVVFFNKLVSDKTLSAEDKRSLLAIRENKSNFVKNSSVYLTKILINLSKDYTTRLLELLVTINNALGYHPIGIGETSIKTLFSNQYIDLIYFALYNQLIPPANYENITPHAVQLVQYILQLPKTKKLQAIEWAFKTDHPLHEVIKNRNELLDLLREALSNMPLGGVTSILPVVPDTRPEAMPRSLYPDLKALYDIPFPVYATGTPNTVLFVNNNGSSGHNQLLIPQNPAKNTFT